MTSYDTGVQIDNQTGLAVVYGEINYPNEAVSSNGFASFFTQPHINPGPNSTQVWGAMNLQGFIDCHVNLVGTPDKPIEYKFQFSNGQSVSFSSIASDVYEEIHPPQWMPSHYWGVPTGPRRAFGVERLTRHDPDIKKTYPYGMITFILSDVTSTRTWMTVTRKPRTTPLNRFTIPGTHDTGTWEMDATSQCQTMVLQQQLDYGIRFIDIRLEPVPTSEGVKLAVFHGLSPSNLEFERDVVTTCENFLAENPGETVIMLINRNSPHIFPVTESAFEAAVNAAIARHPMIRASPSMPTLKDAEKKIVLATRHANLPGIQLETGWPNDSTGSFWTDNNNLLVEVQDVYKFGGITGLPKKVDTKWSFVEDYLNRARQAAAPPPQRWFLNYSSASGDPLVLSPRNMAEGWKNVVGINDRLLAYLKQNPKGYYGTVPMDFPEYPGNGEIIRGLIESNN